MATNKAREHYGGACELVPHGLALKPCPPSWSAREFDWGKPVKAEFPIEGFLEFRAEVMEELFSKP